MARERKEEKGERERKGGRKSKRSKPSTQTLLLCTQTSPKHHHLMT
jgi:hypothetical protein